MTEDWQPRWFSQLNWSRPKLIKDIVLQHIPNGSGLYAFTADATDIKYENILYIGKSDGERQTLRKRLSIYLYAFINDTALRSKHAGLKKLYHFYKSHKTGLYLRFTSVGCPRELEASLLHSLEPCFNSKKEYRLSIEDDELIPSEFLFDWTPDP